MKLFDVTMSALEKTMDLRSKRHALLASNVANSDTPHYRSRELDFGGELQKAVQDTSKGTLLKTDPHHLDLGELDNEAHVVIDHGSSIGADGNNVDLDLQVGKISENARLYDSAANYLSIKIKMLRDAARGPQGV